MTRGLGGTRFSPSSFPWKNAAGPDEQNLSPSACECRLQPEPCKRDRRKHQGHSRSHSRAGAPRHAMVSARTGEPISSSGNCSGPGISQPLSLSLSRFLQLQASASACSGGGSVRFTKEAEQHVGR